MAQSPAPTLASFNNSLVVGSSRFDVNKFTDLNSIYSMFRKDSFTTYKGLISVFNQRKLMTTPLLKQTELNNNVIYVNGAEGKFRYGIPFNIDLPYVVENLAGDITKPGIDGQKFKIKLSENCYTNTDIITADLRDAPSLYITEDEIYEEADGWVYTVQIPISNRKETYYPQALMKPGVQYMKITNVNGEYDTQKSSIFNREGVLDLELQLGGGRSVYHWITAYADMVEISDKSGNTDPRYSYLKQYGLENPKGTLLFYNKDSAGNPISASTRWMKRVEAMLFAEMKMMEEKDLMWSQGGIVQGSGRRSVRVNTGLYPQLRNGNRVQYTNLTLGLIEDRLGQLYYNSGIPIEQRRTKFQVGTAAMIKVSKLLAQDFKDNNPFLTTTGDIKGLLYGDPMNLGYGFRFTTKRFPVAGVVEFEINPAFDNPYNRTMDGLLGEYPIESETMAVFDVTNQAATNAASRNKMVDYRVENGFNQASNIALIKPKNWSSTYWGYELGTQHPFGPGAMQGMFSSSQRDGYAMWMKNQSAIWLIDPTRTILFEKARPSYYS